MTPVQAVPHQIQIGGYAIDQVKINQPLKKRMKTKGRLFMIHCLVVGLEAQTMPPEIPPGGPDTEMF